MLRTGASGFSEGSHHLSAVSGDKRYKKKGKLEQSKHFFPAVTFSGIKKPSLKMSNTKRFDYYQCMPLLLEAIKAGDERGRHYGYLLKNIP